MAYFPQISPPPVYNYLSFFPLLLLVPPTSLFWILSLKQYLVLNADHEANYIAISSSIPSPLRQKYSALHPIFQHPQPMFLPQGKRPSFTTIWNKKNYSSCVFQSLHFRKANGKTKDSSLNGSRHFLSSICS